MNTKYKPFLEMDLASVSKKNKVHFLMEAKEKAAQVEFWLRFAIRVPEITLLNIPTRGEGCTRFMGTSVFESMNHERLR